ncbi:MAG: hypothetical protein ACYDH9_16190 [Limisphaerales bacterium]
MKSETYPLALPPALLGEVRETAKQTGLSLAEAMRQSLKLGLPRLRERLAVVRVTNVAPLSDKVARKLYSEPEDDGESIRLFTAAQATVIEE